MKHSLTISYNFILKSSFTLLLFLAALELTTAQTPQYFNYNAAGTSNNSFPFNQPNGKKIEWLFLPGEINQPSVAPSGRITSISFQISYSYPLGPWTYTDMTIRIGQANTNTLTPGTYYTGKMDTVYYRSSVVLSGAVGQWMTFELDTAYWYDSTQSLILDVQQCGSPGASGFSMIQRPIANYRRIYSTAGCPYTPQGADASVCNLGLNITPPPPPPLNTTPEGNMTICNGSSTSLSASGTGKLGWYSEATGGTYLGSGDTLITPVLTTSTTYYVQDSVLDPSYTRTPVTVMVNPVYSFSQDYSICEGELYNWQGTDYDTAGTYTINYSSVAGCDSTYILHLTLNPVYEFSEDKGICTGETYYWQGSDYDTAGTYIVSYVSVSGCDSVYVLYLTINPVFEFSEDKSICEGDTYNWQGDDYDTEGTYTANYISVSGCDSVYILHLTMNPVYEFQEEKSICAGETYNWRENDFSAAGTYTANYTTVSGCDSVYILHLTLNPVYEYSEEKSICAGETYNWQGSEYNTQGTYTAIYLSIYGCDSTYTLNLTVNTVDVSVTESGPGITANASGATYQWLDCDNDLEVINSADMQTFTATESGNYAVQITQGSCTDTSQCIPLTITGTDSPDFNAIVVFPNPVSNELIIEFTRNTAQTDFDILNSNGQVVLHGSFMQRTTINTSELNSGIYLLKIKNGNEMTLRKVVKN